tara:strand:- start:356 stop:910 length:555 start_codon:yes stop_codon:yes gene_type:complete
MGYSGNLYAQATEVITSQGDLRRGDSSGNPERLAIGANNFVLTSNGTTESWAAASGGATAEIDNAVLTSNFTSTDTSFADVTGLVITIGNITDGKTMIAETTTIKRADGAGSMEIVLEDDSSVITSTNVQIEARGDKEYNLCTSHAMDSNASVIQVQCKTGGSTLTILGSTSAGTSQIVSMSVG